MEIHDQPHTEVFWYSKRAAIAFALLMFLGVTAISLLIPPLQSPDEPNHLRRAYLLSKGEIFLGVEAGDTGGYIDSGLLEYMNVFNHLRFNYGHKMTDALDRHSREIRWSGERRFSRLSNTAVYCPLPYIPQALAFAVGEAAGLDVRDSYYLARQLSLLVTLALILWAMTLYPMPPFVVSILFAPMVLFQFGSASLDAVTFGISVLVGALFMRGMSPTLSFNRVLFAALSLAIFVLATSRNALLALVALPFVLAFIHQRRAYFVLSFVLVLMCAGWSMYALLGVEDVGRAGINSGDIIKYYLLSPVSFIRVLLATLTDLETLGKYWRGFIGILGWSDTPLGSQFYAAAGVLLGAVVALELLAVFRGPALSGFVGSSALVASALCCALLVFFAFLITYNAHPATKIGGITGRYFVPMVVLLGYALFSRRRSTVAARVHLCAVYAFVLLCVLTMTHRLVSRYWMG